MITFKPFIWQVSKVSTRFVYFLSGFVPEAVLISILVVLDTEVYAQSNGTIIRGGHQTKNRDS